MKAVVKGGHRSGDKGTTRTGPLGPVFVCPSSSSSSIAGSYILSSSSQLHSPSTPFCQHIITDSPQLPFLGCSLVYSSCNCIFPITIPVTHSLGSSSSSSTRYHHTCIMYLNIRGIYIQKHYSTWASIAKEIYKSTSARLRKEL